MAFEFKPYEGTEPYVFISYCREDSELCSKLVKLLYENGVRVWFDNAIHVGDMWPDVIAKHLQQSRVCILLISDGFVQSVNCNKELTFSYKHNIPTVPIIIDGTNITPGMDLMISSTQYIKIKAGGILPGEKIFGSPDIRACRGSKTEERETDEKPGEEKNAETTPSEEKTVEEKPVKEKTGFLIVNCTEKKAYSAECEKVSLVLSESGAIVAEAGEKEGRIAEIATEEKKTYIKNLSEIPLCLIGKILNKDGSAVVEGPSLVQAAGESLMIATGENAGRAIKRGLTGLLYCADTDEAMNIPENGLPLGRRHIWPGGTLDDKFISGENSLISAAESAYTITDVGDEGKGSLNGTILNREFIAAGKECRLKDNDEIQIGETVLKFFLLPVLKTEK